MARDGLLAVIYFIIANKMKPLFTSASNSVSFTGFRWFMTIVGVIAAVVGSLVLQDEFNTGDNARSIPDFMSAPASGVIEHTAKAATLRGISVLAVF
jgi:hypothetical protein